MAANFWIGPIIAAGIFVFVCTLAGVSVWIERWNENRHRLSEQIKRRSAKEEEEKRTAELNKLNSGGIMQNGMAAQYGGPIQYDCLSLTEQYGHPTQLVYI
jgi:C4-dicarboxylate-specific signal transduction histidine kinase